MFSLLLNLVPPWNHNTFKHYYKMALVRKVQVQFGPDLQLLPPEHTVGTRCPPALWGLQPGCSQGSQRVSLGENPMHIALLLYPDVTSWR